MLDKIVTDFNLVWDSISVNMSDLYFPLYKKLSKLTVKKNSIDEFRENFLENSTGIGIIDLNQITNVLTEQKKLYLNIVNMLGNKLKQNINGEKVVEIKDIGKSMKTGGRYHETKEGGSLHTDCPQWVKRPNYVGLFCIYAAMDGGEGKYLSAYSLHNELLNKNPEALKILYKPFHFDKREDIAEYENPTIFQPIFEYDGNRLSFRYLSKYIRDGHDRVNQPLTIKQQNALSLLDSLLKNKKFIINHHFESGQALFLNNYRIVHGRSSFRDHSDKNKKRLLLRTWIKN